MDFYLSVLRGEIPFWAPDFLPEVLIIVGIISLIIGLKKTPGVLNGDNSLHYVLLCIWVLATNYVILIGFSSWFDWRGILPDNQVKPATIIVSLLVFLVPLLFVIIRGRPRET